MTEFKALGIEDRDLFNKYLGQYRFYTYEYSFLTLYLWKKYCNVEYAIINDALIIRKNQEKMGSYFMQPLGCSAGSLRETITELIKIKREDPAFIHLFREIEEPFLYRLQDIYGANMQYYEDLNNSDYIYETQKLINLSGDKLSKRKNLYHQFINSYDYSLQDIHDKMVIRDCLDFSRSWLQEQKIKSAQMVCELAGIEDVLEHLERLNVIGMAVYEGEKVIAYTIGEKINCKMAVIHVEKGDIQYKGIYAFINKTFAEKYLQDTIYINREEDMGIAGLRKAKQAYDPVKLEKKYVADIL